MMGLRGKMVGGMEYDALTRRGRRVHRFRSGVRSYVKRKFNRRQRRAESDDARQIAKRLKEEP
jgi:hypothetical protein